MRNTWEVWNSLLEKPIDSMTEVERHINRVNIFVIDFENGSWLYNIAPGMGEGSVWHELRELAQSVSVIGVPTVASYLLEIAEIAEQTDIQIPREGGYWAAADPQGRVGALHRQISRELPEVWGKLEEFTVAHFACKGTGPPSP